jgi:RHS repeat-associated protein
MKFEALITGAATPVRRWLHRLGMPLLLIAACANANAQTFRYAYDGANRMTQVTADGKATRYTYDGAGRLIVTERDINVKDGQPQTLVTYRRYDAADRVASIAHLRKSAGWNFLIAGQAISRGPRGAVQGIDTFRSGTYDVGTGQFTGIPAVAQAFEYDGNARLTSERRTKNGFSVETRYEFDAVGNRKTKVVTAPAGTKTTQYLYDVADRLTEERTTLVSGDAWIVNYAWDGNGNLAAKSEPGRVTLYRFNPQSRLIDIRVGASAAQAQAAAPAVSYAYDAQGNRVRKRTAEERSYLIDGRDALPQLLVETSSTGRSYYVRGVDIVRQTIEGGPLLVHLFPLNGHLGTSMGAVDANGEVVEEVDADAFGNLDQTGQLKQGHLYAGEYWDQDSQLLYLRARWYDPKIGRFISADPFEGKPRDPRSLNRYVYAHSDPVHGSDPSGKFSMAETSIASNIQSTLSGLQADFGFNMIGGALSPQESMGVDDVAFGLLGVLAPQAKVLAKLTKKPKQLRLGLAPNSRILGHNLAVMERNNPGRHQAHHIVAGVDGPDGARNILRRHNIDINSPNNGVWVSESIHCGRHCGTYYLEVERRLMAADMRGTQAVLDELAAIGREVESGALRLYNR